MPQLTRANKYQRRQAHGAYHGERTLVSVHCAQDFRKALGLSRGCKVLPLNGGRAPRRLSEGSLVHRPVATEHLRAIAERPMSSIERAAGFDSPDDGKQLGRRNFRNRPRSKDICHARELARYEPRGLQPSRERT
jgi:hypothetical protein